MRPPKGAAMLVAVGLAMAGAACGSSPAPPRPTQSEQPPASVPTASESSALDLSSALLTTDDLPGFSVADDPAAGEAPEGCAGLQFDPESGASAHAQVLFKQSDLGPFIRERLLRFPSDGAEGLVAKVRSAADTCRSFTTRDQMVGTLEFKVSTLDIGSLADATAAIRLTGRPKDFNITLFQDLVAVRLGNVVILVSNVSPGAIDTSLTRAATRKALARLRK